MKKLGVLFIALGVFTPLVITLITFILPETFASSAKILHPAGGPTAMALAAQRIVSVSNLDQVIADLNLGAQWGRKYKQPGDLPIQKCRELLGRTVVVQLPRGTSIIGIKALSDNPAEAAAIANQLTVVYLRATPGALVIDRAEPNPIPARPNKRLNIMVGVFFGVTFLIIGVGFVVASRIAANTARGVQPSAARD